MGRLTLRLPDTLHQQLVSLAEGEGVSLNQFIVYALTRHVTWASSARQQEVRYAALLESLGEASPGEIFVVEQLPSAAQYNRLRAAVGWGVYEEAVIEQSLPNTLYGLCAFVEGELVGMARIIGDGGMVYYIQDVIVLPAYQRQGIGAQMMDLVMAYIRAHASHNAIIGLMAACGKERFYEQYGFTRRPTDHLGAGMTMFWD